MTPLWMPKGIVGFNRLRFRTPEFGFAYSHVKTAVTVDGPKITLKNASVRIGRSNMTATGDMMGVYRANDERREVDGTFVSYV